MPANSPCWSATRPEAARRTHAQKLNRVEWLPFTSTSHSRRIHPYLTTGGNSLWHHSRVPEGVPCARPTNLSPCAASSSAVSFVRSRATSQGDRCPEFNAVAWLPASSRFF